MSSTNPRSSIPFDWAKLCNRGTKSWQSWDTAQLLLFGCAEIWSQSILQDIRGTVLTRSRLDALVTAKVCILGEDQSQELSISQHIKSVDSDHPGKDRLRVTLDDFQLKGPHGIHQCLIFPTLGRTLAQLADLFEDKALEKTLLQKYLAMILVGLDFLHKIGIVHTGELCEVSLWLPS